MAGRDYFTNIMLDIECATPNFPDPVIIELAAVYFDIDNGTELDRYSTIVNFKSCEELGLKKDKSTIEWLNNHIPRTLDASQEGGKPLGEALSEFTSFVQICLQATRERFKMQGLRVPYGSDQAMIWGNGAIADNVYAYLCHSPICSLELLVRCTHLLRWPFFSSYGASLKQY